MNIHIKYTSNMVAWFHAQLGDVTAHRALRCAR